MVVLSTSPLISHVEDDVGTKTDYQMIPDVDGNMYWVDMNTYDMSIVPLFDAAKQMKFLLTTGTAWGEELKLNTTSIEASSFNKNHPTRFTIHGWNGDLTSNVNALVTEEYLKYGNFNCITVDWSRGAGG